MAKAEDPREALTEALRKEAEGAKDSFAALFSGTMRVAVAGVGIVFALSGRYPMVVWVSIPVILLLMNVARVGIFRYTTANRNYGYILHLERSKGLSWGTVEVSWETLLLAWRIVQPAVFARIYRVPQDNWLLGMCDRLPVLEELGLFDPRLYRLRKHKKEDGTKVAADPRPWFLAPKEGHPGSYLRTMTSIIFILQALLLVPFEIVADAPASEFVELGLWPAVQRSSELGNRGLNRRKTDEGKSKTDPDAASPTAEQERQPATTQCDGPCKKPGMEIGKDVNVVPGWLWLLTSVGAPAWVFLGWLRLDRRRKILESEVLSIHGCAVLWQEVKAAADEVEIERRAQGKAVGTTPYLLAERAQSVANRALELRG